MRRKGRQCGPRGSSRTSVGDRRAIGALVASAVDPHLGSQRARRSLSAAGAPWDAAGFFRDPDALDAARTQVLGGLGQPGSRDAAMQDLRVWIPACATGEDAYSVAILLLEGIRRLRANCRLQVFATDADSRALEVARRGRYPQSIINSVSVPRLARFFTRIFNGNYQIREEVRRVVAFGRHRVTIDPPFSRMDLICCRGALVGLSSEGWTRMLSWFHFGLNQGGCLLLSSRDRIESLGGLFEPVSHFRAVYRKIDSVGPLPGPLYTAAQTPRTASRKGRNEGKSAGEESLGHKLRSGRLTLQRASCALQTSDEQIALVNKELQSINEELRVTKEDLRATNEALERSQAELERRGTALRLTEEQLQAVLDATADGVITIDATGQITMVNRSAAELFGYTRRELVGSNIKTLMLPSQRAEHDHYLSEYQRTRVPHMIGKPREVLALRRNGTRFPALLSVQEITHLNLFVGCVRDLTEDKRLQQEILTVATLEQQRIGQDLHDGVQQELTGLGLLAQNLGEALNGAGPASHAALAKRLARGVAEVNQHIRALARGLVATPVEAHTLPAALDELARRTQESCKLHCHLQGAHPMKIPNASVANHLYRIAQEAVGNAVKHAKADAISIRLDQEGDNLVLQVRDNGVGIQSPPVHGGIGLRLMQHRCTLIGGQFGITTRGGGGTVVSCVLPLAGRGES